MSTTGFSEVCAPAGTPLDRIEITIESAPEGSTLTADVLWTYIGPPSDGGPGFGSYETSLDQPTVGQVWVAFAKYPLPGSPAPGSQMHVPDPGKCVHLKSTGGLTYRATMWADTDPLSVLAWNLGILPLPRTSSWGYAPGTLPPPPGPEDSNVPVDAVGIVGATQISAGLQHACAVIDDGSVKCWGAGYSTWGAYDPVTMPGIAGATAVAAGYKFTCAVVDGGSVRCWGRNNKGQLGDGTTTDSAAPVDVVGVSGATQVAVGLEHACALLETGTVTCWGGNASGELGNGVMTTAPNPVPADVAGLTGVTQIAAGGDRTCALVGGGMSCWGDNGYGLWGDEFTTPDSATPVTVPGVSGIAQISLGQWHVCTVGAGEGGDPQCWGRGDYGQLGVGSTANSSVPVPVTSLSDTAQIAAGYDHSCAVGASGSATCWGNNDQGALGGGSFSDRYVPTPVVGLTDAIEVTGGEGFSCAIVTSGAVKCWGTNSLGQLGHDTRPVESLGAGATLLR